MIRCPHSLQRIGSLDLISLFAPQSCSWGMRFFLVKNAPRRSYLHKYTPYLALAKANHRCPGPRLLLLLDPLDLGRPPEAPADVCPRFCGFENPKMALTLSGNCGFEPQIVQGFVRKLRISRKMFDFRPALNVHHMMDLYCNITAIRIISEWHSVHLM
jgi:hypothetical protein